MLHAFFEKPTQNGMKHDFFLDFPLFSYTCSIFLDPLDQRFLNWGKRGIRSYSARLHFEVDLQKKGIHVVLKITGEKCPLLKVFMLCCR